MKLEATDLTSHYLKPPHIYDLELLKNDGFSLLTGFLSQVDYGSFVCSNSPFRNLLTIAKPK